MSIAASALGLTGTSSSTSSSSSSSSKNSLTANDFIQMMVTQLQNQDPTQPTNSADLLAQMSQIGQLQSSTDLQTSLQSMTLQNGISNASAMIGKTVTGKDTDGSDLSGIVTSVKVSDGSLSLQLDSGKTMSMDNVLSVAPTTTGTTTTGATATS